MKFIKYSLIKLVKFLKTKLLIFILLKKNYEISLNKINFKWDNNLIIKKNPEVNNLIQLYAIQNNKYENELVKICLKYIKQGYTCLDIGSCYGFFSLIMYKLSLKKVHIFEPNIDNCKIIKKNFEINNINEYELKKNFITSSKKKIKMMVFKNSFISQNFDNGVISSEIIRYINEFNSYFEKNENFKLDSKININKIINNMRSIIKTNRNKYFNNKLRIDYIINNFMQNKDRYNFEIVEVKSETVDNYTKKNNLNFDFIKIDIEGEELKALQGMRNLISNNIPKVVVV